MNVFSTFLSLTIILFLQSGCSLFPTSPPVTFDLTNPLSENFSRSYTRKARVLKNTSPIVITQPLAAYFIDSDSIIVRESSGMLSSLKSVRWSERIPRLLQLRLVRSLENKGMVRQIRFPSDPADAERQLLWEIPRFQIAIASDSSATVEIQVVGRIIDIHSGHVKAARIFSAKENLETVDIPQVVTAFDTALSTIMFEMCTWIG